MCLISTLALTQTATTQIYVVETQLVRAKGSKTGRATHVTPALLPLSKPHRQTAIDLYRRAVASAGRGPSLRARGRALHLRQPSNSHCGTATTPRGQHVRHYAGLYRARSTMRMRECYTCVQCLCSLMISSTMLMPFCGTNAFCYLSHKKIPCIDIDISMVL